MDQVVRPHGNSRIGLADARDAGMARPHTVLARKAIHAVMVRPLRLLRGIREPDRPLFDFASNARSGVAVVLLALVMCIPVALIYDSIFFVAHKEAAIIGGLLSGR